MGGRTLLLAFAITSGVILLVGCLFALISERYDKSSSGDWLKDIYP